MTLLRTNLVIPMVLVAVTFSNIRSTQAEIVAGVLDAASIVNGFNSMNGGTGLNFVAGGSDSGVSRLDNISGKQFADTSAYHWSKGVTRPEYTHFFSFCVEPNVPAHAESVGKLNYANGKSQTTTGSVLTVGAAYLYMMFATNQLSTRDYNPVGSAIRYLIGDLGDGEKNTNWLNNSFLNGLLGLNSQDYWSQVYNPDNFYSEIGNYSVFMMNVTSKTLEAMNVNSQDRLYLAAAATPYIPPEPPTNVTPEPATMLVIGLGIAGLAVSRRRK